MALFGPSRPSQPPFFRRLLIVFVCVLCGIGTAFAVYAVNAPGEPRDFSRLFQVLRTWFAAASRSSDGEAPVVPSPVHPAPPRLPALTGEMLDGGQFQAPSILVKDAESGAVLFRKDEYRPRPIASITKIMSALVLSEFPLDFGAGVRAAADAIPDPHVVSGETYTLEELWHAALVGSSNRAMLTLVDATRIGRERFVAEMNAKARQLGLRDAVFVEPTGLDPGNMASASDIALLLEEALRKKIIADTLKKKEHTLLAGGRRKKHHLWNTNWLQLGWIPHSFAAVEGGKTGYIPEAGYNFTAKVTDGQGRTVTAVVLGAPNHEARFVEARDAADWVFDHYTWPSDTPTSSERP